MIRINDEEEEDNNDKTPIFLLETTVDQSTESNKQTDRPKSLPPKNSSSSSSRSHSIEHNCHQRRRHASDSHEPNHQPSATFLVTSFLQYLRNQLRATTNNRKNDYQRFIGQNFVFDIKSKMSNGNQMESNDENEILTLIDLLVLRVECLTNENQSTKKKKKKLSENYPSVAQVDQNLIEYLYYLFTKFTHDDQTKPILDKSNFVNVCQTLVRNGCFDISSSSSEPSTITDQTIVHEYPTTIDNDKDTWLVVDFEQTKENLIIPNSPSDDQLLSLNENDKSYESFSSSSLYLSPNTSLIDLQNLVQEFDEHNQQDEITSNVIIDSKTGLFNENIYIGLTNDQDSNENNEQMTIEISEQMSQREKKMQDRWSRSIAADGSERPTNTPLIGIDFPQIAVLRRKFSTSKKLKPEEINTSMTMLVDTANPDQINELLSKDSSSSTNTELEATNVDRQQTENLSDSEECQTETITNSDETSSLTLTNTSDSNLLLSSSSVNEMNTVESIEKEEEEEEEKEKERCCNDDYNLDEEKKNNNSNFVYDNHASGILLINDEPTQTALLVVVEQEKKEEEDEEKEKKNEEEEERERPSPPLQTLEQSSQQRTTEDESPIQILSNDFQQLNQPKMNENDERYAKVEIEEIPDEDEDEAVSVNNIDSIEPVDFIRTDEDEKKETEKKRSPPSTATSNKEDPLLSCYEKAFTKVVERNFDDSSTSNNSLQSTVDDPIALRALQRFEQRMNAVSASSTKPINDEPAKGKSSWSGSISSHRKSMENLFKNPELQPVQTNSEIVSTNESQNDAEQLPAMVTVEPDDKREVNENEEDKSKAIEYSTMVDDSGITPYRFQIEGRRRLNTIDRLRERRQSRELLEQQQQQQQSNEIKPQQTDYTVKSEDIQDPIIRRALERFDEKNRTLTQTKSMNYDDIQDPITRRALMRLESNLKRTLPTPQSNENRYIENYTLGSLQQPSTNNKTKYISVHQHYCAPTETNNGHTEQDLSVVRSIAQPIYLTSANQPLSFRQRSRSEDMLSSKDLSLGQTTNLDEIDTSTAAAAATTTTTETNQLQRNRSSNELELTQHLSNPFIKALEPTFVRTTESSVSYVTPTQTYSAYSCEYTRPRRNPTVTSTETLNSNEKEFKTLPMPKPAPMQNDIQRPTAYRPIETPSYAPMQSSTATTTSNYYNQQPIPSSSSYSSNNFYQTSTSEDPIIRRALDRFNNQVQNSYLSRSNHPSDSYFTGNRSNLMTTSTNSSTGYQSIIGRRRQQQQTRHDEPNNYFVDNPSVGDGYTSSYFSNSQNAGYPTMNRYMEMPEPPPIVPPRLRRFEDTYDQYRRHSTDEFLSENYNSNNNNNNNNSQTLSRDPFIHHAYPATITNSNGFRPINVNYHQDEYFDRAQSSSSTNSSESFQRSRQQIKLHSPDNSALGLTSDGTSSGDSGFHRLAYTGTKASLSKSSSNLLNNKNPSQPSTNQIQTYEIDVDPTANEQKYQRSKSVEHRGRLTLTQTITDADNEQDQQSSTTVQSSKFTPIHSRPPPRVPLTPTTMPRTMPNKRPPNANHFSYSKSTHGNIYDHELENEENIQYQDENRERIGIPVHRYPNTNNNNNIQSSPSTSSMNSNLSRTKPPVSTPMNFERRESNGSIPDGNRISRRSDDHRLVSPGGQRRNIPVSVFSPAKIENKRPAPAPPTSANESQQLSGQKTPTNSLHLNELTASTDKHDNPKKMNVFERLFRGNKKKT